MPKRPLVALMIALMGVAGHGSASEGMSGQPKPLATRQTMFSIPFRIAETDRPEQAPVEVQLYVSTDAGASWSLVSRVPPTQGSFLFRAAHDKQYWFIVRTLDRNGQLRPAIPPKPEMSVIVDTTPPELEIEAKRGESGQITARWSIREPHLQPESLRVQYRTGQGRPWEAVAIDRRTMTRRGETLLGDATWWVPTERGRLEIRAEASDLAGNPAVSHAQLELGAATGRPTVDRQKPAGQAPPVAASDVRGTAVDGRSASVPWQPNGTVTSDSPWAAEPAPGSTEIRRQVADVSSRQSWKPSEPGSATQIEIASHPAVAEAAQPESPPAEMHITQQRSLPSPQAVAVRIHPPVGQQHPSTSATTTLARSASERRNPPQAVTIEKVSSEHRDRRVLSTEAFSPGASLPIAGSLPLRMVNGRMFELEYPTNLQRSAATMIELWGSVDRGRSWSSYGIDSDGRSPVVATVESEGIYGFCFAACEPGAQRSRPPHHRRQPDVWIGVDWTKPVARFTGIRYGRGPEAGQLTIGWEAHDWQMAARPIALAYSGSPGGPWRTIVSGLENTGTYRWQPAESLPDQLYLRMEVRDEAGNLTIVESTEAVSLAMEQSGVRIRQSSSTAQSKRPAPKRYYFR